MNELALRAVTGAIYVALTLGGAFAGPFTTSLLFLPVCVIAAGEMHRLIWGPEEGPPVFWSMIMAGSMYVATTIGYFEPGWDISYTGVWALLMLLVSATWLMMRSGPSPASEVGGSFIIMLLVSLPFGALPYLFQYGNWMFAGFMIMLWTNDTGAYLVGRTLGHTKLMPAISPNKTVEGFVGGVLLTLGAAYILALYQPVLAMHEWLLCGLIVAVTSTLGDLLESAFKRARGVKDSGKILPGHGGMLDRFDGFLLAVPAVLLYLRCTH